MTVPTRDLIQRELAKRSLAEFAKQAWHVLEPATPLKWGWALDAICQHLEAVTNGQILRLLINVPPGSMKSLLVGVIWPAWEWGPRGLAHMRFVGTAHSNELAIRDNLKCRRLIQSKWYQAHWPVELTGDQNAKTKFENTATGSRQATSFEGITGYRGDRVILDDPHSVHDANSLKLLANDVELFREAMPSRVNNEFSAIVIAMQRLNELDISAVAIELGYEHLMIPMRFEADRKCSTVLGWSDPRTEDGQLMFPERFPEAFVAKLEFAMGSYAVAGQMQQRPAPREGGFFDPDQIEIVDAIPAGVVEWMRGWDLAASTNGDYTVGVLLGRLSDGRFIIADVKRDRLTADKRDAMIKRTASADGREISISLPQDPGQAGKTVALHHVRLLAGFTVLVSLESGDKETRANPVSSQVNVGNMLMLRGDWNKPFTEELRNFPAGRHDDQVDALARAFNEMTLGNDPNAGFLAMIRKHNAERAAATSAPSDQPAGECPFAPGSVEYERWHGRA